MASINAHRGPLAPRTDGELRPARPERERAARLTQVQGHAPACAASVAAGRRCDPDSSPEAEAHPERPVIQQLGCRYCVSNIVISEELGCYAQTLNLFYLPPLVTELNTS